MNTSDETPHHRRRAAAAQGLAAPDRTPGLEQALGGRMNGAGTTGFIAIMRISLVGG